MYANAQARESAINNARNYAASLPPHYAAYVDTLISQETNWNPDLDSGTGASGIAQFTRGTWNDTIKWMERNPTAIPMPQGMNAATIADYDTSKKLPLAGTIMAVGNAARLESIALKDMNKGRARAGLNPANTLIEGVNGDPRQWATIVSAGHKDGQGRIPLFIDDNGQFNPDEAIAFYQQRYEEAQQQAAELRVQAKALESSGAQGQADRLYKQATQISNGDSNGQVFGFSDRIAQSVGATFDLGPLPYTQTQAQSMYDLRIPTHTDNNPTVSGLANRLATGVGVTEASQDIPLSQQTQTRIPQPGRDFGVPTEFNLSPFSPQEAPVEDNGVQINAVPPPTQFIPRNTTGDSALQAQPATLDAAQAQAVAEGRPIPLPAGTTESDFLQSEPDRPLPAGTDPNSFLQLLDGGNSEQVAALTPQERDDALTVLRQEVQTFGPTPERLARIENLLDAPNQVVREQNEGASAVEAQNILAFNAELDRLRGVAQASGGSPEALRDIELLLTGQTVPPPLPGVDPATVPGVQLAGTDADSAANDLITALAPLTEFQRGQIENEQINQAEDNAAARNEQALADNAALGILADLGDPFNASRQDIFGLGPTEPGFAEQEQRNELLDLRDARQAELLTRDILSQAIAAVPDISLANDADVLAALSPEDDSSPVFGSGQERQTFNSFNTAFDVETPTAGNFESIAGTLDNISQGNFQAAAGQDVLAQIGAQDPVQAAIFATDQALGIDPFLSPIQNEAIRNERDSLALNREADGARLENRLNVGTPFNQKYLRRSNALFGILRSIAEQEEQILRDNYLYGDGP